MVRTATIRSRTPRLRIAIALGALIMSASIAGAVTSLSATAKTTPGPLGTARATLATQEVVGITQVTLTDDSRGDTTRGGTTTAGRTMLVTIRYPATSTGGGSSTTEEWDAAVVGAAPLVIFAPGFDVSADTYAGMEHELAAAGFVVAAIDFPMTSSAFAGAPVEDDVVNQAGDVSFAISALTGPSAPARLVGHVGTGPVSVVGHSDGGVTAAGVAFNSCCADARIGAGVILSGAESRYGGDWFPSDSSPVLLVHGTDDEVNSFSSSQQLYDDATGAKTLVGVLSGTHLGPFTTDAVRPAISALIADFLHAHLQGDRAAADRLVADASAPGLTLLAAA